jgi:hypothetical protein
MKIPWVFFFAKDNHHKESDGIFGTTNGIKKIPTTNNSKKVSLQENP